MNILYIVDTFSVIEPLGVLQLSAITKAQGHKSFIAAIEDGGIEESIRKNNIHLAAFSFMSTEAQNFHHLSRRLRVLFPNLKMIAGGPHATYYPQIASRWPIDASVVGEGDAVLPEIVDCFENGKDISHIPNVHTKTRKNTLRRLVENLDSLPYADRELVENVEPFKYVRMKTFFATRGCPYKCTYCFNSAYNKMNKDNGEIFRRRSVKNLVGEIEQVIRKYPTDFVRFGDDTFVIQYDEWVEEFCEQYKKRVGIPFYFLIHPNLIAEDLIKALKGAGCHSVMMGIESGDAELRRKVLERYVSDERMLNAFKIFHKYDIKVFSNAILGLPASGLQEDLKSLKFTLDCRPTYAGFTVFTPFPGTELYRYSREHGFINEDLNFEDGFPLSMQQKSCLNHITDKQKEIHQNIVVLGTVANAFPLLRKLIENHLIYWKPNRVFNLLAFFVRNYLITQIFPFRKSPRVFLRLVWKVMKIDLKNYAGKSKLTSEQKKELELLVSAPAADQKPPSEVTTLTSC
jgi:radical SAM superfamily enzyme YgiQ (UPF0313 family)